VRTRSAQEQEAFGFYQMLLIRYMDVMRALRENFRVHTKGVVMALPTQEEVMDLVQEALNLEDPSILKIDTMLFGEELGLDSIDALEIGTLIKQRYDIELKAKDDATRKAFASVATLHAHLCELMSAKEGQAAIAAA
jgi:acyl carrier protein